MGAQSVTNWTVISQVSAKFHYTKKTKSGDLSETGADITNFVWDASWRHFALVRLVEFGHRSKKFIKNKGKDEHVELRIDNNTANINGKNLLAYN